HLEFRALQEQGVRSAGVGLYRRPRPRRPAHRRGEDPAPPARGDADHLRLLLRLPDARAEEPDGRPADAEPALPVAGDVELTCLNASGGEPLRPPPDGEFVMPPK